MPLTWFESSFGSTEVLEFWFYRVGGFVLLNIADDPAWLALMFC
jgi:hypothetical protein